ncbi:procollagen-proline 4-dioxygenase [Aureococcus anophagefferens]|nr:procollagen-proline 4-dioxygenase [Aureococcus anophagefferens]
MPHVSRSMWAVQPRPPDDSGSSGSWGLPPPEPYDEDRPVPCQKRSSTRRLFAGVSPDHFEELQIARYLPGEQFEWHEDAVPPPLLGGDDGGQRLATLLVYLTGDGGDASGGATCFRDLGPAPPLAVKPVAGDALLFFPAFFPSATPDGRTVHRAAPAVAEKWVSQLWLHEATYPTVILDDNPR